MNKKIPVMNMLLYIFLACTLTFVLTATSYQTIVNKELSEYSDQQKRFSKLFKLDKLARSMYVNKIDEEKLTDGILDGYMNGLGDKYGLYLNKDNYAAFNDESDGKFTGIGVNIINLQDGTIKIVSTMKDSPAERAGIKPGDVIQSIGGQNVSELGYYETLNKFLGKEGSTVDFTILRNGEPFNYSLKREKFQTYSVSFEMLENSIGYIKISSFDGTTYAEFKSALDFLTKQGASSLIFDVRYNNGGDLDAICKILDMLLPEGPIIRIRDKDGKEQVIKSDSNEVIKPMVVLINDQTYSAAELFSAALRDYKKAELIGVKTYGKGTMQYVLDLGDGTGVDLSTRKYLPPTGDNYEGIGVSPDIEVKLPDGVNFYDLSKQDDPQLQKAIDFLNK
ncbi:MAG: S41 family peptidase [Bacillota bacterium]|nr:S41 family peptidase [Bacillota bacterium]